MSRLAFKKIIADNPSGTQLDINKSTAVRVFVAGSTLLATIYTTKTGGTLKSNPFNATDGVAEFYAEPGLYDIECRIGDTVVAEFKNYALYDPAAINLQTSLPLQFETVAAMKSGTAMNYPEAIDFSQVEGRQVKTVYNNLTSRAGGADYVIWSLAAYRTAIGNPAWVPDGDGSHRGGDHYIGGGTDYTAILQHDGAPNAENFGADSTGQTDSTASMTKFIQYLSVNQAAGRISEGDYQWANVPVGNNFKLSGAGGETNKTRIKVNANNGACFKVFSGSGFGVSAAGEISLSGLSVGASAGVTGAKFWHQEDHDLYTSYAVFDDIETWGDLSAGYDGYFIFCDWKKCRHGFRGSPAPLNQFIRSTQDNAAQSIETNLCKVESCRIFNTSGAAAIELERGFNWHITDTDFEGLENLAISAKGIIGLLVSQNWFEEIAHSHIVYAGQIGGPSPQGSWQISITGNHVNMDATTADMIQTDGAAFFAVDRNTFIRLGTTKKLITDAWASRVLSFNYNRLESTTGFIFGSNVATQIISSVIKDSVINSSKTAHIQMVPKSKNLNIADFTKSGLVSSSNVSSGIGLSSAISIRLGSSHNLVYYQIPPKLLDYLRGKTITVCAVGYAGASGQADQPISAAVWTAAPSGGGAGTNIVIGINADDQSLQISSMYYSVESAEDELYVGVYAGGSSPNSFITIEALDVTMGRSEPSFVSLS